MTPAHPQTEFFTLAGLGLGLFTLLVLCLLMRRSAANLCVAGFLACVIPAPVMLVAHSRLAIVMFGLGLACLVPAYLLAEDQDDDGRGGDDGPRGPEPDRGPDSDLWCQFERDFWSHVERTGRLVKA